MRSRGGRPSARLFMGVLAMRLERNPTEARQAKPVGHMRYVLSISFALAALALLIVYLVVAS